MMRSLAILVPLALAAAPHAAAATVELLVPKRTIMPNELLAGGDLVPKHYQLRIDALGLWLNPGTDIAGRSARRILPAGKPVPVSALMLPDLVKKGVAARAVFASDGIAIETTLVPLSNAPAGALIRARNPGTGVVVDVMVGTDGTLVAQSQ